MLDLVSGVLRGRKCFGRLLGSSPAWRRQVGCFSEDTNEEGLQKISGRVAVPQRVANGCVRTQQLKGNVSIPAPRPRSLNQIVKISLSPQVF